MSLSYKLYRYLWDHPWFDHTRGRTVYKRLCQLGEAPDYPFETEFFGMRYAGNLKNSIDFSVYYYGAFEKPLLFFLRDTMLSLSDQPGIFCDVGANVGQHSLFMSSTSGHVHAFEPYAPVRERLEQQIVRNSIDNLTVHPYGLSDATGSLPFYAPTGRNEGVGSFDSSTVEKGNSKIGDLALVRGDEYFDAHGIGPVAIIKIDVEGFEKSVLRGLAHSLERDRPVVVCELTYSKPLSIVSMAELESLFPADYRFFTFDNRKPDGSKARRKGARARLSGDYDLVPFLFQQVQGQDDIVACPAELCEQLPRTNLIRSGD